MRRLLLGISLLFSSVPVLSETLFGPVEVTSGIAFRDTFGMYCRCTAYFVEIQNGVGESRADGYRVALNDTMVIELDGSWTTYTEQVELREIEPNEISVEVMGKEEAKIPVQVYERDVTPEPVPTKTYTKQIEDEEIFGETFVLNHWADRFYLDVTNGNPDGSNRISSGRVMVDGEIVVDESEFTGSTYEIRKEIEFSDSVNRNRVVVSTWGEAGDFVTIGVTEAAQTVSVEEVWQKDFSWPSFLDGAIRVESGEPIVTLNFNGKAVRITGDGSEQILGETEPGAFFTSPTGKYTGVRKASPGGQSLRTEILDGEWNSVSYTDNYMRAELISDDGNTIASLEGGGLAYQGEDPCELSKAMLFDQNFSSLGSPIPIDFGDPLFDRYHLAYDGSCLLSLCGEGQQLRMYNRDGSLLWVRPWGFDEFMPVSGGNAVLASPDTLFMIDSAGTIQRRVTGPSVNPNGMGFVPRLLSEEVGVQSGRNEVRIAQMSGPQSCWEFEHYDARIGWTWISKDGSWLLSGGIIGTDTRPIYIWLIGAGGEILWTGLSNRGLDPWVTTAITAEGEYFLLHSISSDEPKYRSELYRVNVE